MIRLALLLVLAGCATPAGNCRLAHTTYYAMLAGGSPKGALDNAEADVAEICDQGAEAP